MNPKEKAKELVNRFENAAYSTLSENGDGCEILDLAKQCALIAVEEIIDAIEVFGYSGTCYDDPETGRMECNDKKSPLDYWYQVKTEIENL